jgi:hypothetical protein
MREGAFSLGDFLRLRVSAQRIILLVIRTCGSPGRLVGRVRLLPRQK